MSNVLATALSSGAAFVIVGIFGSLVEAIGKAASLPRVESFGRAVEAFALDAPKLYSGLANVLKGKNL